MLMSMDNHPVVLKLDNAIQKDAIKNPRGCTLKNRLRLYCFWFPTILDSQFIYAQ